MNDIRTSWNRDVAVGFGVEPFATTAVYSYSGIYAFFFVNSAHFFFTMVQLYLPARPIAAGICTFSRGLWLLGNRLQGPQQRNDVLVLGVAPGQRVSDLERTFLVAAVPEDGRERHRDVEVPVEAGTGVAQDAHGFGLLTHGVERDAKHIRKSRVLWRQLRRPA